MVLTRRNLASNFQFSSKQATVAAIVADSPYAAQDAVDLVRVDYEPLEAVIDGELTTKKGAPLLHEDASQSVELSGARFMRIFLELRLDSGV